MFDDERMPYKTKVTETMSWNDIPTCKEAGIAVDYLMLRGIFMPAGVTPEQVDFYVDLFKKVRETPDWKKFMEDGAFNQTFMTGPEYAKWVEKAENTAQGPDEGSGLPGQALTAGAPPPGGAAPSAGARHAGRRPRTRLCRPSAMNDEDRSGDEAGISTRTVEVVVALLLFAFGATRHRRQRTASASRWGSDGPQSGYFPFYIGLLICISSAGDDGRRCCSRSGATARRRFRGGRPARRSSSLARWQVLSVLLPALVYVLFVQLIGIYVASAVYIALFMVWLGKYAWLKSVAVGARGQRLRSS